MRPPPSHWRRLNHLYVTVFLVYFGVFLVFPAMNDVIVNAVCDATTNACSLALYLTGFQQAITGLGGVVMMPVLGNLSDVYGRKKLLVVLSILNIIPLGILACRTTTYFFYAHYAVSTFTGMLTVDGISCLALAYLADNVVEEERVSAFGILYGVMSASNAFGTLAARFLSIPHIFQVATLVSVVALVYMVVLLKESNHLRRHSNSLEHPILESQFREPGDHCDSTNIANLDKRIPLPKDVINLFRSSPRFSMLACISFFEFLGDMGIRSFLLFFLKAQYNFKKDQFADILLITCIGSTLSNVFVLPRFGPYIGEEQLIIIGLSASFLNASLNSIGWATWVPYALGFLGFFFTVTLPTVRTMVSKEIGPNEQGIAQGCIVGVTSLANVASVLIFTPLSAIFFAEDAPADFTGFSVLCISLTYVIGLILAICIKVLPHFARRNVT